MRPNYANPHIVRRRVTLITATIGTLAFIGSAVLVSLVVLPV